MSGGNYPLFSVLVANYNNGIYIEECLQSIFAQTYKDWEIIIVDDGSTDKSREIYAQYASDKRIKVFYNIKNRGCGYTKRKCVEHATGEICGFVDPDDAIIPKSIEIMVETHQKKINASIISAKFYYTDLNLKIVSEGKIGENIPEGHSYLTYGKYAITQFATFKRKKYELTEGINPKLKQAVDQDLYYKLEEVGNHFFINEFLYKYRITDSSISQKSNAANAYRSNLIVIQNTMNRRAISNSIVPNITKQQYKLIKYQSNRNILYHEMINRNILKKYYHLFKILLLFPSKDIKYKIKCIIFPHFA